MFCGKCGKENINNTQFCIHCGADLSRLTPASSKSDSDTLDRAVTVGGMDKGPQYDTLDIAATQGREATILAGQYRILKKLGEGGMGVVYLAEDMEMGNRKVAVKVLPAILAKNRRAVENLRKEAMTAIELNHPNIIRLYGFHSDGEIKFLVMEYIDGNTLEEIIEDTPDKKLSLERTLRIAKQAAAGLDCAHNQKQPVIHRDLKPSNIMIDKHGAVKVLDFGIAREMKDSYTRITGKQDTSGTLPYMSPEQLMGEKPMAAMDIYSLGAVIYECLSGHPPFYTGDLYAQIRYKEPESISGIPGHINKGLFKALSKASKDRPVTGQELIKLLKTEPVRRPEVKLEFVKAPISKPKSANPANKTITNSIGMSLVYIPAGDFMMGSPDRESGRYTDEGLVHKVRIRKGFYMGQYEVTQAQYQAVIGTNPSNFRGDINPVEMVSWHDAEKFCKKLRQIEEGKSYRLPTEAEWEYACRAGSKTEYCFGDSGSQLGDYAWYGQNSSNTTHPVGQKLPNVWGLYDMHGNVWEWCQDTYDANYYGQNAFEDPINNKEAGFWKKFFGGDSRVLRGGSWIDHPGRCRAACRCRGAPGYRGTDVGFRVVCLDFQ